MLNWLTETDKHFMLTISFLDSKLTRLTSCELGCKSICEHT